MPHEFLKHWRVVRYLIKKQYDLSQQDLEMLLFLYSEGRFTKDDFSFYEGIMSWDSQRFARLKNDGWINQWRKNYGNKRAIYCLSHRGKTVMARVYRLLLGEEKFPESARNPLHDKTIGFEARYLQTMKKINRN